HPFRRGTDRLLAVAVIYLVRRRSPSAPAADHWRTHIVPLPLAPVPVAAHRHILPPLPARAGRSLRVPAGSRVELPTAHGGVHIRGRSYRDPLPRGPALPRARDRTHGHPRMRVMRMSRRREDPCG